MNTERMTDVELASKKNDTSSNTVDLVTELGAWWDLEAPYQRDSCWNLEMERYLIKSIMANIPIGTIHLVQKTPGSAFYWVLDGKQRLTTLKKFMSGHFYVNWNGKNYAFKKFINVKIELLSDVSNKAIFDLFKDRKHQVVKWDHMSLLKQRNLFEDINRSSSLNSAEKIYCPYFFAKALLLSVFSNNFVNKGNGILRHGRSEILKNRRFSGLQWLHRIMLLLFGSDLTDSFAIRSVNKNALEKSARAIDNMLCNYFTNEEVSEEFQNDLITSKVLMDLGWYEKIELLKKTSNAILSALDAVTSYSKKIDCVTLTDLICFTMEKVHQNILTPAFIEDEKIKMKTMYTNYVGAKNAENLARHTTDTQSIALRHKLFEKTFNESNLDKSIKNRPIPANLRTEALMKGGAVCPIEDVCLNDHNVSVDHIDCKSIYGKTEYAVISSRANRLKNCNTKTKMKKCINLTN